MSCAVAGSTHIAGSIFAIWRRPGHGIQRSIRSNDFHFDIGVSGSTARFVIGEYGSGFTEDLGASTVEIWGQMDPSMNGSSSAGSFSGAFTYCDGLPPTNWGTDFSCPVRPAYCEASNHQFTLTRR